MIFPPDLYQILEFDKVLDLLERSCLGELGVENIRRSGFSYEKATLDVLLTQVWEYKSTIERGHHFPLHNYSIIRDDLRMLDIEGYVLGVEGLRKINVVLLSTRDIFKFFAKNRDLYPYLYAIIQQTRFDDDLLKAIERVIDEEGEIRPDASPELMKIRNRLNAKRKELEKRFRDVINIYQAKGWLADTIESFRNGRRVLAVQSTHKRSIKGIIHDESTTGRTAFVEPEPIIEINNDIFELETEEQREIYRILRELSQTIRPYTGLLREYERLTGVYDVIQAKAHLAYRMKADRPTILQEPFIGYKKASHPLLLLKNAAEGKSVVPFTLKFLHDNHLLLLSGPNAGGKSVTMKAVGLMQLMMQFGMLVSVGEGTEMGIFKKFFADIGDQQSLEDDLSTYSSRLRNARYFLEHADGNTLVLIDEFGSGTDPKIGGAIAEAILHELNQRKVFGVITTHYSNLKIFAFKNKGIVNGAMEFDKDTLSPTYRLKIGQPGSSYAFEIAQKIGLQEEAIAYARRRAGKNETAVDDLLIDLQREKQELEVTLASYKERQKRLDQLILNYEKMSRELEFGRKKLKLDMKQQELQQNVNANREIERVIKEIREEKNLEKAKQLVVEMREEKTVLQDKVTELTEAVYYAPTAKKAVNADNIKPGDYVKMRTGSAPGVVESVDRTSAVVVMGEMRMKIKLRDLQHTDEPLEMQPALRVKTDMVTETAKFQPELDVRGTRRDEALQLIEAFVDEALMTSVPKIRIIHGKGDGVLRMTTRKKLREYADVLNIRHEPEERGGDGVTVAEFE